MYACARQQFHITRAVHRQSVSQSVRMMYVGEEGKVTGLGYGVQEAIIIPTQTNNDAYYRMIASMTFPFPQGPFLVYSQNTY